MKHTIVLAGLAIVLFLTGCQQKSSQPPENADFASPSEATLKILSKAHETIPVSDTRDFEDARKGLIYCDPSLKIENPQGRTIWDMPAYNFLVKKAPGSVHPKLWRQAQLNNIHGLFKVSEGIYQIRGYDLANMSIIEGKTGWIIVDPLTAQETAEKAMSVVRSQLGDRPVSAIIYTHSHVDHFGGTLGILPQQTPGQSQVPIIAPEGFMAAATSENIMAGIAMGRRAGYMYGRRLTLSEFGHIDSGLGKSPAFGKIGILPPTCTVSDTPTEMDIDGIRFIFQYTPESEAPAEMTFYLPDHKAFCGAEIVNHTLHNLYTLRGAKVRDALKWSGYIDEAMDLFGQSEVYFGTHHWPIWGNSNINDFLKKQRDIYKFIHDQTLRLANNGYTPKEIAEEIKLPQSLGSEFYNGEYYGTLSHNTKAVYQHYFGWYDGNPAHLNPLPPSEAAKRYVEFMGGPDAILAKSKMYFDKGEYRWVAEVLNHLVFAEPENKPAKDMLAKSYAELAYQSESGPWRDVYLTAAFELRNGPPKNGLNRSDAMDLLKQTPVPYFFDAMALQLNGPDAEGKKYQINIILTDLNESYLLTVENSVLHHKKTAPDVHADAAVRLTHELFLRLIMGNAGIKDMLLSDDLQVHGSRIDLVRFFSLFDKPDGTFNIVTP